MSQEIKTGKLTLAQINAFLAHPLIARLATAVPSRSEPNLFQPHNVPVWFYWDGKNVWISAFESTRKVKEIKLNPYIAVLIDVESAIDGASAVLFEGKCELIREPEIVQDMSRIIYTRYMGEEGVKAPDPQSWIIDPENHIVKLTPSRIYSW